VNPGETVRRREGRASVPDDPVAIASRDDAPARLGLRAQIAIALIAVLALAATMAIVAIGPLTQHGARQIRQRAGTTLARAVAGQAAMVGAGGGRALQELLDDAVGPGALSSATVVADNGAIVSRAGRFSRGAPQPPFSESVTVRGDVLTVTVVIPSGGAFVGEASLAPDRFERALPGAVLLYATSASLAALFVVYVLLTRTIVRPVEALTRAAERVAAGRRDVQVEPSGAAEVVRAARAFGDMTRQLAAREDDLSRRVEELESLTRELRAAQELVIRSERLAVVGGLAAGIAHEVGNPLAAIVGLTEVLREGGTPDAEVRDFAARIGAESQRIHRTIRDLLDYARSGGAVPVQRDGAGPFGANDAAAAVEAGAASANVSEAVTQVARLLEPQKSMRGIRVVQEIDAGTPDARIAPDRLVQVLLNLALNAAQAIAALPDAARGDESLRFHVFPETKDTIVIDVEDSGPGIAPEIASRVFEPFFTTKPAGEGTGLGLAICAVIVEGAGGTLRALPRDDGARGTRMRIVLSAAK